MYSNVHCFCFFFFHFIILIRQSKRSLDLICQRETGLKKKNKIRRRISDVHFYIGLWKRRE